jgi:hypothetical protein
MALASGQIDEADELRRKQTFLEERMPTLRPRPASLSLVRDADLFVLAYRAVGDLLIAA